jgi:hypothetical protein
MRLRIGKPLFIVLPLTFQRLRCLNALQSVMRATCFPKFLAEILFDIFDQIDYVGDCFCLALTSKRCWLVGQPRMRSIILELAI